MSKQKTIWLAVLALLGFGAGWLVKSVWWPQGSDNMFLVTDGTPIQSVVVCNDKGEVLWRIVASGSRSDPKTIPYGDVPPGFKQEVPTSGAPRDFVENEHLQVHVLSKTQDMGDGGKATGPRQFLTLVNFGGPRPERADQVECRSPENRKSPAS
jgi:hypothetical protein